jgi:NodT family efflux transporter outer membrane factor (OMF) lipoprotein
MSSHTAATRSAAAALGVLTLAGCMVGPNYKRPAAPVPPAYKAASAATLIPPPSPPNGTWKQATPANPQQAQTDWWKLYNDPELTTLEAQVTSANQTLKAAYDAYVRSSEQVKVNRADLFPTFGVGAAGSRNHLSGNRPFRFPNQVTTYSDMTLEGQASWNPDLWGKIRRQVQSSAALAQASSADLAYARLSLQSELAVDYFQLRALDSQQAVFDQTVQAYQRSVQLTKLRFQHGLSSQSDLALAQTLLDQTVAEDTDIGVARAQYEDAIATLIGVPASTFSLPAQPLKLVLPPVPTGLPSELLERRPDIAAAERRIDAANAQIGIAQAAFYPSLNLNADGGFESAALGTFIQGPSSLWSLGASASELIFDAGQRRAVKAETIASYNQSTDNYRQTVLQAFQEVEDNLAAARILEREARQQAAAVTDAQQSLDLSTHLYTTGLNDYLQVITVQTALLSNQRTAINIAARQATASVQLIQALGGGWNTAQLPKP